ncbi:MAG: 50S ribosomal protein L35ae [Candidatus Woesearchaeota archaeon]
MEGTIVNFRMNRHSTYGNHMVVVVNTVDSKEKATKLIGKTVKFNTGKKDITGKISGTHGNKGAVRVIFETGMPGQAVGKKVKIE